MMAADAAPTSYPRCDRTAAWAALAGHYEAHGRDFDLREAFARDATRFEALSFEAPEVFADLSKNRLDAATLKFLLDLARECGLEPRRDAMLAGERINVSENRAVLHTALRAPQGWLPPFAADVAAQVHAVLDAFLEYADEVRAAADGGRFTDVVNIGIGGSDLGPAMAVRALAAFAHPKLRFHFVSNVDGHDIAPVLARLDARRTLFIVTSKTFTTQETMANAAVALAWFQAAAGLGASAAAAPKVAEHFVGVTTNLAAAAALGITRTFGFWDWVGGRYSMWSAVGLSIAIAVGGARFRELLAGAHAMDRHFATTPLERNVPVLLGLIDVWYRNFHGRASRCVAPYHQGLARLPAYLQQLEMESNGKGVDAEGAPLPFASSPVIWGEPGTNGQHAFFQMLHQGTEWIPVEFIAVKRAAHGHAELQRLLLANCLAQGQALMLGRTPPPGTPAAVHRRFPGNRPSTTLVLEELTPRTLGALIALYEHRVFTSGALWGIDSFDQWGVELGKVLANQLAPRFEGAAVTGEPLDASTAGLLLRVTAQGPPGLAAAQAALSVPA